MGVEHGGPLGVEHGGRVASGVGGRCDGALRLSTVLDGNLSSSSTMVDDLSPGPTPSEGHIVATTTLRRRRSDDDVATT
jgi:hypothetical protein